MTGKPRIANSFTTILSKSLKAEEYLVDKWQPAETRIKLKPVKNDQRAFGKLFDEPSEYIRESNLTVAYL